ncbi:hypothetical protein JMA_29390 [Jeotgalibacillus malaysiensis]|uniref:Glycosyl transferase family 1 domain-containing protein n=1 Tax=Jeotgalibacillus malaysiensis TaxID=1508404 RepID=A0A0B5AQ83_9BACL|nr:hypothetical protein [Jeotgalibacillus malaysiensis]AJD92256.1 hypothetical protein JMA_29390 [Jeotgalibacillus malaysiensis]
MDLITIKYPKNFEDEYLQQIISDEVNIYRSEVSIINKYLNRKNNNISSSSYKRRHSFLNFFKRIIKSLYFFPDTDKGWINKYNIDNLKNDYNIIISSSDTKTSHFVAKKVLKKLKGVEWYQIWGDPWKDDINLNKLDKLRVRFYEKHMLRKASKIFYVSLPTTKAMSEKYKQYSNKIFYLGRSFLNECKGREINIDKDLIFTYTGSINKNRNITNLISKIEDHNISNDRKIHLNIYGACSKEVKELLDNYDFVSLKGIVGYKNILEIYKDSDVLLFIDNGDNTTQIPGKLYDYFGTDRPIYALVENYNNPVTQFILSTKRCVVNKNSIDNIDFNFLNNLKKESVMKDYSGKSLAKKLINYES